MPTEISTLQHPVLSRRTTIQAGALGLLGLGMNHVHQLQAATRTASVADTGIAKRVVYSRVLEVACWAHARRKFFDARKNYPREAHQVLEWIGQMYDIEDRARELPADSRCELRCAEANPVLDRLEAYLAQLATTLLPKSALAKAVTYARNQWNALRRYTTDGRLTIDNNVGDRCLHSLEQSNQQDR